MLDVTFHNVTITILAEDGPRAYAALSTALGTIDCDWITDTFTVITDGAASDPESTDILWPSLD
jgi:hypothetical protein